MSGTLGLAGRVLLAAVLTSALVWRGRSAYIVRPISRPLIIIVAVAGGLILSSLILPLALNGSGAVAGGILATIAFALMFIVALAQRRRR
jgi:prepilin signal peptidase PulO-like enzyme (type II secretory pathway)